MGGTLVKQPLPAQGIRRISPFLLLHHFGPTTVSPGKDPLGVGAHPHRGFEPVTFLFSGGIQHRDSKGNVGNLKAGDVQWMTAGSGIVHSEMASPEFLASGGTMEGIQLRVNPPNTAPIVEAHYQDIPAESIPVLEEEGLKIRLVAGEYKGKKGPARTHTPVLSIVAEMEAGAETVFQIPILFNAMLYIVSGVIQTDDKTRHEKEHLLHFNNDGEGIRIKAAEKSRLLVLGGQPINEPLAQYGPFVMNNQQELVEAIQDYQMGKMGQLT